MSDQSDAFDEYMRQADEVIELAEAGGGAGAKNEGPRWGPREMISRQKS